MTNMDRNSNKKMHVVFDLGGVVFRLDKMIAIQRFKEIGVTRVEEFLDDYAQKDVRIKVITQENKGLSGARNSGMIMPKRAFLATWKPAISPLSNTATS